MMRGVVTAIDTRGAFVRTAAFGVVGPVGWVGDEPAVGASVLVADCGTPSAPDLVVVGADCSVPWKGGSIAPWNYGDFADLPEILRVVDELRLNVVTLPVVVAAADIHDSTPVVDPDRLAWAVTIAEALPKHVKVIAEPYPWINDGTESETLWVPDDVPLWFASWSAACVEVAQAFPQAAMVYVGSNMVSLEAGHSSDWSAVAAAVRAVTGAQVSYRCNWWYEDARLDDLCAWAFLRDLDVVSVAAYFELTETESPAYDEVRTCLDSSLIFDRGQSIVGDVARLHEATGKPIFFGELVCSHWNDALKSPWAPDSLSSVPDRMVQQRLYRAYTDAFAVFPWWRGFSVYGLAGFDDSGYTLARSARTFLRDLAVRG